MTAVTQAPPRIMTLDIVRGVAVMGILAMNIVAFSMPPEAYLNPVAYGAESTADLASWAFNFVFIDGKMRGLFSFLFGASMLLVILKAKAKGEKAVSVHYRRMLWLLLFGYLHFYFIWYGDILTGYASMGMIAWFFRSQPPRKLIGWGIGLVIVQFLLFASMAIGFNYMSHAAAAPGASAEIVTQWASMQEGLGVPTPDKLNETMNLFRGGWLQMAKHQLTEKTFDPLTMLMIFGWETLAYMLFGMAALKSGFFTGDWDDARYRKIALIGFGIGIPVYAALAAALWWSGFTVPMIVTLSMAGTVLFRPVMVVAIAALIILLTRRGGWLVERIAATGRAAFTNYLGTSILMTALFYGWGAGLFGTLSRIELWLVVVAMWGVMLLWSKPWLDRHLYGPFEWVWRTLARWQWQPMRRPEPAPAE